MSQTVKTKKGTALPLMSLKGKPYMQVAHRIVWFNEDVERYAITTETNLLEEGTALTKATVTIYDSEGKVIKMAQGSKVESKKDFADYVEKSETGAIGRAITTLGYGTAYALADLDEGDRIVDAPVSVAKSTMTVASSSSSSSSSASSSDSSSESTDSAASSTMKRSSFGRGRKLSSASTASASGDDI